jgi:hypothetical protein
MDAHQNLRSARFAASNSPADTLQATRPRKPTFVSSRSSLSGLLLLSDRATPLGPFNTQPSSALPDDVTSGAAFGVRTNVWEKQRNRRECARSARFRHRDKAMLSAGESRIQQCVRAQNISKQQVNPACKMQSGRRTQLRNNAGLPVIEVTSFFYLFLTSSRRSWYKRDSLEPFCR